MSPAKLQPALLGGVAIGVSVRTAYRQHRQRVLLRLGRVRGRAGCVSDAAESPGADQRGRWRGRGAHGWGHRGARRIAAGDSRGDGAGAVPDRRFSRACSKARAICPPEVRQIFEQMQGGLTGSAVMGAAFIFSLFFSLFFYSIFGLLGGLLGATMFRKNMPPPVAPPSTGFTPPTFTPPSSNFPPPPPPPPPGS